MSAGQQQRGSAAAEKEKAEKAAAAQAAAEKAAAEKEKAAQAAAAYCLLAADSICRSLKDLLPLQRLSAGFAV